jgi:ATP-dependent Lon protease
MPRRGFVVFPGTTFQLVVGRPRSLRALDCASRRGNRVFLAAQRDQSIDDPGPGDVEPVGSICDIVQKVKHRRSIIGTIVQTLRRHDTPVRVTLNG